MDDYKNTQNQKVLKSNLTILKLFLAIFLIFFFSCKSPTGVGLSGGWEKTFGGGDRDRGKSVQQTTDGGYILVGWTKSFGAGGSDVYLIKTDAFGSKEWTKTFGGSNDDEGHSVQQTSDGGYIITGITKSLGVSGRDVYLIKTDESGNEEWFKTFGGSTPDIPDCGYSVEQTLDGGYIITGYTESYGSGASDVYLIKTDEAGNEQWYKTFGGADYDVAYSVQQTEDGGYIIAGETSSFGEGAIDVYLIKTNGSGNEEWSKTFGGNDLDGAYSVQQTNEGGYIIAGFTASFAIDYVGIYLIKLDASGNEDWIKIYAGSDTNDTYVGHSVHQTIDGGYIVTGFIDTLGTHIYDVYLLKTDEDGNEKWSNTFGGSDRDRGLSIQQTTDRGYIIAGYTESFGAGDQDVYLLKTDANGNISE